MREGQQKENTGRDAESGVLGVKTSLISDNRGP